MQQKMLYELTFNILVYIFHAIDATCIRFYYIVYIVVYTNGNN